MIKPCRVLGYARASSVEQALGTSLADQQERIGREATHRGVKDVRLFIEAEGGGYEKYERREQLHALMREARAGDIALVDKLDRFSRDPEVTYRSIRELREKGVGIFFIAEQLDPSTPNGEMALGMWITFARSEHRRIRERMVGTREGLQAQGYYTIGGRPPFGYHRPNADSKDRRTRLVLEPVEAEAEIVREIFRQYAIGFVSQRELAEEFEMSLALVQEILQRRIYIGHVQLPPSAPGKKDGEWIKGKHEPIVDLGLFAKVQAALAQRTLGGLRPKRGESKTSSWILRDVATCARCKKKMRSAYRRPSYYYLCSNRYEGTRSCDAPYVRIEKVEGVMRDVVKEALRLLRECLVDPVKPQVVKPKTDAETKRKTLIARRERFIESHVAGVIDLARLKAETSKIDNEIWKLDAELAEVKKPQPLDDPKVRREMLRQMEGVEKAADALKPAEMRAVVNVLFRAVKLEKGQLPDPELRTADEVRGQWGRLQGLLVEALGR